jgi:hypothetical protein
MTCLYLALRACASLTASSGTEMRAFAAAAALIQFQNVYSAMNAILCLRGTQLPGGRTVHVDYVPFFPTATIKKFFSDHTRIAVVLLVMCCCCCRHRVCVCVCDAALSHSFCRSTHPDHTS